MADSSPFEITIQLRDSDEATVLSGPQQRHIRALQEFFPVTIKARNTTWIINGEQDVVTQVQEVIKALREQAKEGDLSPDAVAGFCATIDQPDLEPIRRIRVPASGKMIVPKTKGQARYIDLMQKKDLCFCEGPAGTGKTYLAVAVGLAALKQRQVKRLIMARPAVEAGEKLGFLPGDLVEKVNPYLAPLFDALADMIDADEMRQMVRRKAIEVIPLAFMRGRTFNKAFVILDEAQNATVPQMKMVLTRLGHQSQMVVVGDASQSDLNGHQSSGFGHAMSLLEKLDDVGQVRLGGEDIVRHDLVQKIVEIYEKAPAS